ASDRLDQPARPPGDRRLPPRHRLRVRPHQPGRGPGLHRARSAGAPRRARMKRAEFLAGYARDRVAVAAAAALAVILLAALLAPVISPQNPYDLAQLDILDAKLAPGAQSAGGGMTFWLGTDDQGRDMLSGILYGLRISLGVGVVSTVAALAIGML